MEIVIRGKGYRGGCIEKCGWLTTDQIREQVPVYWRVGGIGACAVLEA